MAIEQTDFTLKQLQRLMSLYSKAVEFYSGKSDTKYFYYNDKIQNLLTQPKVLDMLSEKIENTKSEEPAVKVEPDLKTKEKLKKKERILKMNLHITNQETEKQDLKSKIIEDHASAQDQESKIIQSNLSEQSDNLRKRLEMRKKNRTDTQGSTTLTTTSSTPNIMLSSHKDKLESNEEQNKSNSSGSNSVDQNFSFHLNFDNLGNEKFSEELMNRLKLLQEGYDEEDFDDLFWEDEDEVNVTESKLFNECITILNKNDEEISKVVEEHNKEIEQLYEDVANQKFEKISEIKVEYKYRIKLSSSQEEIKELEKERDEQIKVIGAEFDEIKELRLNELKLKHKESSEKSKYKKEIIEIVTKKVKRSLSRKASRGRTPKKPQLNKQNSQVNTFTPFSLTTINKDQLMDEISKGIKNHNKISASFKVQNDPNSLKTN